jgi:hypothetical protein
MLKESALKIELHRRGKVELLELQTDRALVGSGAHCDVRLAPDEAAVEQLAVESRDDEVFVRVYAFDPPCRLNGAPFLEGRLSPDALIEFGPVALCVRLTELSQGARPAEKTASGTHPAVQALALVALAFGFYFVLNRMPAPDSALSSAEQPPALFTAQPPGCPQADLEAARSLAEQDHQDADNRRERSPFYPRDGLSAVPLYERATACYERAGEHEAARETREAAKSLKQRMADEFHVRQVRIERFIAQEKLDALRHEVLLTAEFVQDKSHPYAHWLSALAREADVRTQARGRN